MLCKFNKTFERGKHNYKFNSSSFIYKERKVFIISNADELNFKQVHTTLPFLYSGKQVLNITETTDIYDLKFKIGEYHNEILFILRDLDGIILDKCSIERKELICQINKEKIEEIFSSNEEKLGLLFYSFNISEDIRLRLGDYNDGIYVNYSLSKKDIYIQITNLLQNTIDIQNFVTYETNVTNISNVNSKRFSKVFV